MGHIQLQVNASLLKFLIMMMQSPL
jgi:hypothetical protein